MRGGALAVLIWSLLLLLLFLGNWIYAGDRTQIAVSAGSVGLMLTWGVLVALSGREALRRGPPPTRTSAEGVSDISFGAAVAGFAVATIVFGLVWGHFLVYFGAGLFVAALIRLAIELRSERETLRAYRSRPQPVKGQSSERPRRPAASGGDKRASAPSEASR
jgi:hypothetical protein